MASTEISSKQNWEATHEALNLALKKEIEIMREVLANLHQEELSLLESDALQWQKVMQDRSNFVMQLHNLRLERMTTTETLTKLAVILGKEEILPTNEASSCEVLTQLDQLTALLERTNLQNCRNDALFDQVRQKEELPLYCNYPHPLHTKKKRKTSVATYTRKR